MSTDRPSFWRRRIGWLPQKSLRTAPAEPAGEDPVWPAVGAGWQGMEAEKGRGSRPGKLPAKRSMQVRPHHRIGGRPEFHATTPLRNLSTGCEMECSLWKSSFPSRSAASIAHFLVLFDLITPNTRPRKSQTGADSLIIPLVHSFEERLVEIQNLRLALPWAGTACPRPLEQQLALARVARERGRALELRAGLVAAAELGEQVAAHARQAGGSSRATAPTVSASTSSRPAAGPNAIATATARFSSTTGDGASWASAS